MSAVGTIASDVRLVEDLLELNVITIRFSRLSSLLKEDDVALSCSASVLEMRSALLTKLLEKQPVRKRMGRRVSALIHERVRTRKETSTYIHVHAHTHTHMHSLIIYSTFVCARRRYLLLVIKYCLHMVIVKNDIFFS